MVRRGIHLFLVAVKEVGVFQVAKIGNNFNTIFQGKNLEYISYFVCGYGDIIPYFY